MATKTWNPFGVSMDITATGSSVTRKSATQYTVKINASWEVTYSGNNTNYGMYVSSGDSGAYIPEYDGTNNSSGSGSFTGTYSISGNGSATKSVTVTFKNYKTDTSTNSESSTTLSFDVSVPAWTSYTVTYNANGGSGAPTSQTKWKDQDLTLSTTEPTRTGYTFLGWSTSKTATTATYSAGGKYTTNSAATLYAVWQENKLTINYYSNYATSAFDDAENTVGADKNVIVLVGEAYYDNDYSNYGLVNYSGSSDNAYMTRIGYTATGNWGTKTSGGTLVNENTGFASGQAVAEKFGKSLETGNASVNLYAQWEENTLTVNYYSNYATSAFDGALNEVGADKNVVVNTYEFGYEPDEYYSSYGLGNYSHSTGGLYMERTRYDATGYWCTTTAEDIKLEGNRDNVISYDGGVAIGENVLFDSGQELAEYFGLTLEDGSKEINLYAHWVLLASRLTIYLPDENGNIVPQRGLVHIYDDNGDVHYGIVTLYVDEYDENGSNAHVVI